MHNMAAATAIVRHRHTSFCKKSRFRNLFSFFFLSNHFIYYSISSTISKFHISMFVFLSYWCFWVICSETRKNSHSKRYISLFAKFTHFLFFFQEFFYLFMFVMIFFHQFSSWLRWDLLLFCFCKQHVGWMISAPLGSQLVLNNKV